MLRLFSLDWPLKKLLMFFVEEGLILCSLMVGAGLIGMLPADSARSAFLVRAAMWGLLLQTALYLLDGYDLETKKDINDRSLLVLRAVGAMALLAAVITKIVPGAALGNGALLPGLLLASFALLLWRALFERIAPMRALSESVAILGYGEAAKTIGRALAERGDGAFEVKGFIGERITASLGERTSRPGNHGRSLVSDIARIAPMLGDQDTLAATAKRVKIDRIVVQLADMRNKMAIDQLVQARVAGVAVEDGASFYERAFQRCLIEAMKPSQIIFGEGFQVGMFTRVAKRALDIVASILVLLVSWPVLLLVAWLIKREDGGPIFFHQDRVGQGGINFRLTKFRTMSVDAEAKTGAVWAQHNDPRVTRLGKFLRRTRIDEIPQVFAVLRGDMSFVGPRPERDFFVTQLTAEIPFYQIREAVKPGITGWAQVRYPYGASVADAREKLRYDIFYIKNLSVVFDLLILLRTIRTVLSGSGSR